MIIGLHQRFHVRLARRIVPELWILPDTAGHGMFTSSEQSTESKAS